MGWVGLLGLKNLPPQIQPNLNYICIQYILIKTQPNPSIHEKLTQGLGWVHKVLWVE